MSAISRGGESDEALLGNKDDHVFRLNRVNEPRVRGYGAMKARAHFRLMQMLCCGQMLCGVNPQLLNYLDRVYRAR